MRNLFTILAVSVLAVSTPASAAVTLGNTGIDANWKVGYLGYSDTSPTNAQAASTTNLKVATVVTKLINNWIVNDSVSQWVSTTSSAASSPGYYVYSNTFTAAAADVLNFNFAVDDKVQRVLLNGNEVAGLPNGTYRAFTFGSVSGFSAGINTLTFLISNNGNAQNTNPNPSGFRLETLSVAAVPEPSTWGMMLTGVGLMGASMRYRRKSTSTSLA